MARDWHELFITDGAAPAAPAEDAAEVQEKRRGFFKRLRENMAKTRVALAAEVQATLFEGDLDEETWERLEEALIMADVGAMTTAKVVGDLEQEAETGRIEGGEALSERLMEMLAELARTGDDHIDLRHEPSFFMVVGVSGTGMSTTLG
jgi:fused signal recognition particle receptor